MKKLIQIALCIIMALSLLPLATFAASELDENENALIEKLKAELNLNGASATIPEEYINMAENYFLSNDVSVSETELTEIINNMDETIALIKESNVSDVKDLPASVKNTIIEEATKSAEVLDLTLNYDYSTEAVSIVNGEGTVVAEADNIIKKTGFDVSPVLFLGLAAVLMIFACFVISKKTNLFEQR
ncbi:MAG: hypothetical protein K0S55_1265 [Clostridia bacterium]|jgi:hypothetical protein|nr:hypothetical protein [Clostridia bacterium]